MQADLAQLAQPLERAGLYLPQTHSKRRGAHHWLAHSLRGPRVFRKRAAQFDVLSAELTQVACDAYCVSSEDFETLLMRPAAMARIAELADRIEAQPIFVIYLRSQTSYFESLYLQLLRAGLSANVQQVLDDVLSDGAYAYRKWIFHFDYRRVVEALEQSNTRFILRNYHDLKSEHITADFLTAIGQEDVMRHLSEQPASNPTRLTRNLERFARNQPGQTNIAQVEELDQLLNNRRPRLSPQIARRLRDQFAEGNAWLVRKYGCELPADIEPPPPETPILENVFSSRTLDWVAATESAENLSWGGPPDGWFHK